MPHGRRPVEREETDLGWFVNASSMLLDWAIKFAIHAGIPTILGVVILTLFYSDPETAGYVWQLVVIAAIAVVLLKLDSMVQFVQLLIAAAVGVMLLALIFGNTESTQYIWQLIAVVGFATVVFNILFPPWVRE